jgi:AcrR family transcriptional regulator
MPRPKTGDKRAAILCAATKTIAEDGVGASTARIAKAAAVAEGSLFRYFPDKDKLLNELYRELKLDMRNAMIAGFPVTGSLRKRAQHIWNAYVTWGMESPAKRRAMMQLTVSERITDQSRQEGQAGFEDATKAMRQLVAQGKLAVCLQPLRQTSCSQWLRRPWRPWWPIQPKRSTTEAQVSRPFGARRPKSSLAGISH